MTRSHGLGGPRAAITLLLMAALAMAAALSLSAAAPAGAASTGGLSTGGTGGGEGGTGGSEGGSAKKEGKYRRIWRSKVTRREKRWARRTARCESGRDPKAIGGGGIYRGAFQFLKSTWRRAPRSPGGDPVDYRYKTQAVVAVALKRRDGAGHWPNCG